MFDDFLHDPKELIIKLNVEFIQLFILYRVHKLVVFALKQCRNMSRPKEKKHKRPYRNKMEFTVDQNESYELILRKHLESHFLDCYSLSFITRNLSNIINSIQLSTFKSI